MPQAVMAKCPGCQKVLRMPTDWLQKTVCCKHCGLVLQVKPKAAAAERNDAASPHEPMPSNSGAAADALSSGNDHFDFNQPPDLSQRPADDSSNALTRYRKRARLRTLKNFVGTLLFLGLVGVIIYWSRDGIAVHLKKMGFQVAEMWTLSTEETPSSAERGESKPPTPPPPPKEIIFPRRLLAISANNYLYANPVSAGAFDDDSGLFHDPKTTTPDRTIHAISQRFAEFMHVPPTQFVELSDAAPPNVAQPPLKPVIEGTIRDFLAGCRKQDRVILMFVGHAIEIGDEAFLVPIEGELKIKESLIPLKWLYEELARCKAQQKLLIMDTCRFNPARGLERPAGGPMGPKLDAALKNPPPGVQVWSACVAGQYSYEGFLKVGDGIFYTNGLFVNALADSLGINRVNPGIQSPESPLPVEVLANGTDKTKGVNRGTTSEASEESLGQQTPRLSGAPLAEVVAYDPNEPAPAQLAIQLPTPPEGGQASREVVRKILDEIESKMAKEGEQSIKAETLPIFGAARLDEFGDDGAMTPLREEILKTTQLLKKHAKTFKEDFRGQGDNAAIKNLILGRQKDPARAEYELQGQLESLQDAGKERAKEKSKRWQANYDYVLARLKARLAYIGEYNYVLGQIRKDSLPKRDPAKHSGYRLAAQENLQNNESRKLAVDARKLLTKVAEDYKGTPWEVLAKRQALNALGLEWQPIP